MAKLKQDIFADSNRLNKVFTALYGGADAVAPNATRYQSVLKKYEESFSGD